MISIFSCEAGIKRLELDLWKGKYFAAENVHVNKLLSDTLISIIFNIFSFFVAVKLPHF